MLRKQQPLASLQYSCPAPFHSPTSRASLLGGGLLAGDPSRDKAYLIQSLLPRAERKIGPAKVPMKEEVLG